MQGGQSGPNFFLFFSFFFSHSNPISVMFSLPPFFLHYFVEVRSLCAPTFVATLRAQGDWTQNVFQLPFPFKLCPCQAVGKLTEYAVLAF